MWQWWVGFVLKSVGEVGNFLAYGLAPITMVAPLGGIPVIYNFISSRVILLEHTTTRSRLIGAASVVAGGVLRW